MKPLDLTSNFHKMQRRERLLNDTIGDSQQNLDSWTSYRKTDLFVFSTNKLQREERQNKKY